MEDSYRQGKKDFQDTMVPVKKKKKLSLSQEPILFFLAVELVCNKNHFFHASYQDLSFTQLLGKLHKKA